MKNKKKKKRGVKSEKLLLSPKIALQNFFLVTFLIKKPKANSLESLLKALSCCCWKSKGIPAEQKKNEILILPQNPFNHRVPFLTSVRDAGKKLFQLLLLLRVLCHFCLTHCQNEGWRRGRAGLRNSSTSAYYSRAACLPGKWLLWLWLAKLFRLPQAKFLFSIAQSSVPYMCVPLCVCVCLTVL